MTVSDQGTRAGVEAEINYVRNPPPDGWLGARVRHRGRRRTTRWSRCPGTPCAITDGRGIDTDLDREGFRLVHFPSAVADFHQIQDDPAVDAAVHRRDRRRCSTDLTGAARVFMLGGGKKRYGESAIDKLAPLKNAKPARVPARRQHRRLGRRSSRRPLRHVRRRHRPRRPTRAGPCTTCGARSRHRRRTSRWRCATRSRSTPADEVTVTAITAELAGRHRPRHDELRAQPGAPLVLLPRHDDRRGDRVQVGRQRLQTGAVRVAHTAFTDPTCPPGVPTRASVEMRALAVFA